MKSKQIWTIIALISLFLITPLEFNSATTTTIYSSNDTQLRSGVPNGNYGSMTTANMGATYVAIINFDLSNLSMPTNSTITSVSLSIFLSSSSSTDIKTAYPITNLWTESQATWNNRTTSTAWTSPGGDYDIAQPSTTTGSSFINFDVTTIVNNSLNGLWDFYGFLINNEDATTTVMRTKEYTGVAYDPELSVSYSLPQPTITLSPNNNTIQASKTINMQCNASMVGINSFANITELIIYLYYANGTFVDSYNEIFNSSNPKPESITQSLNWTKTVSLDENYEFFCGGAIYYYDVMSDVFFYSFDTSPVNLIIVDSAAPTVSVKYPLNSVYYSTVTKLNYTVDDISADSCWYSLNGGANSSAVSAGINFTGLSSAEGFNTWRVYCNDSLNRVGQGAAIFSVDTILPKFLNLINNPSSPTTYSNGVSHRFNSTVTQTNGTVFLTFNNVNYTTTNSSNNFTKLLSGISAGTYNYRWGGYGSGVTNRINQTIVHQYVINKAIPLGRLTNSTPWTINYGTSVTIGYSESNLGDGGVTYNIFRDGVNKGSGETKVLSAGSYNYKLNTTGGTNYTSNLSMDTKTLTVNKVASQTSLTFSVSSPQTYGTAVTPTCSVISGTGSSVLRLDGSIVSSGAPIVIGGGVHTFNCSLVSSTNYTYSENVSSYTINPASTTTTVTTNPSSPIIYPTVSNFSCSNSAGQTTILKIDGVDKSSQKGLNIIRAAGTYTLNCSFVGNTNYTKSSQQVSYTINKANPSTLMSLSGTSPIIYPTASNWQGSETNTADADLNYQLFANGNLVSNPDNLVYGVGTINYIYNTTGGQNYTSGTKSGSLTVNQNTTWVLGLSLSPSSTVEYPTETTATGSGCPSQLVCNLSRNDTGIVTNPEVTTLGIGSYNYTFNTSGNTNYSSKTISLVLKVQDTESPTITIHHPTNITYRDRYSYNISLNVSATDEAISTYWYSLNGGANTTFSPNITFAGLVAGSNTLKVWVNDTTGNVNSSNVTFYLAFTPKINNINISNSTDSYSRNSLLNGLVGWWKFDEDNNKVIDSRGMVNGTAYCWSNGVTSTIGKIGSGYSFDATPCNTSASSSGQLVPNIYLDSSTKLDGYWNLSKNYSITIWAKAMSSCSTCGIIHKETSPTYPWGIRMGEIKYHMIAYNGTSGSGNPIIWADTDTILGEWDFLTVTWDADTNNATFYVDGIAQGSTIFNHGRDVSNTVQVRFASRGNPGFRREFNGTLDETRFYNRTLSPSEIQQLYSITNPVFQEYANITINATITDEDTSQGNLYYEWFVDGVKKVSGFARTIFNWIFNQENQEVRLKVNDTNNYTVNQYWNISTTFINPLIYFNPSTQGNMTWKQTGNIFVNITAIESNINNVKINFDGINQSFSSNSGNYYWINKTGLSSGTHTFYAWINDSVSNFNRTSIRTVYIDLINPLIAIAHPQAQTYNTNESLSLNFTVTDTNLESCWYNINGGTNVTLPGCQNSSFNVSEASHTIYVFANDSSGRIGTSSVSFEISLAAPQVNLYIPANNQYLNYNHNVAFNFSAIDTNLDTCELWGNFTGVWALNKTQNPVISAQVYSLKVNLSDGGYKWNVLCNDTSGKETWGALTNRTVYIDTIIPQISYSLNTELNNSNFSRSWIFVNTTWTELNFKNISFTLFNSSMQVYNLSSYTTPRYYQNYTLLPEGVYYYNVTLKDLANNINATSLRKITLDTTGPLIIIDFPQSLDYTNNNSIELNYTVTDNLVGVSSCWYNVYNLSGGYPNSKVINNTFLPGCQNITFPLPGGDIDYSLTLFANDSLNNTEPYSITFQIKTIAPGINLGVTNNYFFDVMFIVLNTTATDADGLSTCELWGDFNGTWSKNQTKTGLTSGLKFNWNPLNLSEGEYNWSVWCNDTLNNNGFSVNRTFGIDITPPVILINTPASGSTVSTTFSLNYSVSDTNNYICFYNLVDSYGVWYFSPNQTLTCGNGLRQSTIAAGIYNLYVWGIDKAGNLNYTYHTITLQAPSTGGGGGGGSTIINVTQVYNNTFCGDKICQVTGNDIGLKEDYFSCAQDCPPANIDTMLFGCFSNDPNAECVWEQLRVQYIGLFLGMLVLVLALATTNYKGKQVPIYRYIAIKSRRKR